MKTRIPIALLPILALKVLLSTCLQAQSLDRMVVGSAGDIGSNGGQFYTLFIGETLSGTDLATLPALTMGIEQPITPVLLEARFGPAGAKWQDERVAVSWTFPRHPHSLKFEVLRSLDGQSFQQVGEVSPQGFGSEYSFWDQEARGDRDHCYQIRWRGLGGQEVLSERIFLGPASQPMKVLAYPNPFEEVLHLEQKNGAAPLKIRLYDGMGRLCLEESFEEKLEIQASHLVRGNYKAVIRGQGHHEVINLTKN